MQTDQLVVPRTLAPRRRPFGGGDVVGALIAAVGASVIAAIVMKLWQASPHVPFAASGDANAALAIVKNQLQGSWYLTTDHLGAPFGQQLYDYAAFGDGLTLVVVKIFGLFTSDPALVLNAIFLLTFPVVALSCYVAMRVLGIPVPLASGLGIVYSLLPYHFQRGESHIFLVVYFAVPLAGAVLVRQMRTETMLEPPQPGRKLSDTLLSPPAIATLVVCFFIGGTGIYYAFFFLMLAALVAIVVAVHTRSLRPLASAAILCLAVAAVLVVVNLPSLLHWAQHGSNSPQRPVADIERYGLKLSELVLPVTGHRLHAFADLKAKTLGSPVPSEGTEALGLIGAVGFLGLLALTVARMGFGRRATSDDHRDVDRSTGVLGRLAALNLVCVLVAVVGGLATVIGVFGFTTIRGWNRISVYIAFFALSAVGIWMTRALARFPRKRSRAWLVAVATILVVFAAFDQTTGAFVPDYATASREYNSDAAFVNATERALGRTASIFQLPYVPYPENPPVNGMVDYDHLRGYLHSDTLNWSYGGVKGGATEWQPALLSSGIPASLAGMAAAGFDGLYIDREGYADHAASLELQLRRLVGSPLFESTDGRLVMYDLRPVSRRMSAAEGKAQTQRIRRAVLQPPYVDFSRGFYAGETDGTVSWHWAGPRAEVDLVNPDDQVRSVRVTFTVESTDPSSHVTIRVGGSSTKLAASGDASKFSRVLRLHPGVNRIAVESDAPPVTIPGEARDLRVRVLDFSAMDPALRRGVAALGWSDA